MDGQRRANAASFGRAAEAYERGRPSYPAAAIDWLLPQNARHVLDLGAGTGKLTRELQSRGLQVTAVEPSDGMREQLISALPEITALAGRAEEIPLPDSSFDCVLVAQAWHWVEPDSAVPEVARVLRPGGRLGLLWNLRDERLDWVAELGRILGSGSGGGRSGDGGPGSESEMLTGGRHIGDPFGPVQEFEVAWEHEMTPSALIDLVVSRSYVITASADRRDDIVAQVRGLLDTHPALAGRARFHLPYVTQCFRSDKMVR